MLETVRAYADERLDADKNAAEIHRRHCRHYLALAERAEPELFTHGEAEWLPKLDAEAANLRAALDWGLDHDPTLALRLAGVLCRYWDIRNRFSEGLQWIEAALHAADDVAAISDRARARRAQVTLLRGKGVAYDAALLEEARGQGAKALALSQAAGDPAGIAEALLGLAGLEVAESHPQRRRRTLAQEALVSAREAGDARLCALALMHRASALPPDRAATELSQAVAALRKLGAPRLLVVLYNMAAYSAIKARRPELAQPLVGDPVSLARDHNDPLELSIVCGNVGLEALFMNDLDRA